MFADTAAQLRLILWCLVFGFAFGIFYDLIRAFRPKKAPVLNALADVLLVTAFFLCLFLMGYTAGEGVQRLYSPVFCLAAAALYFAGLSSVFRVVFGKLALMVRKIFSIILYPLNILLKSAKKLCKISKNFFYSLKIWYTMKCKRKRAEENGPYEKGNADETEKGRYYY